MTSPSRFRPSPNFIHGTASFDSDVYITGNLFVGGNISLSGTGEANTGTNLGSGEGIFQGKSGVVLNFRSLLGTGSVSLISGSTTITISGSSHPEAHAPSHEDGGDDEIVVTNLFGELADPQKVTVRVNNGLNIGSRPRLNFLSGTGIAVSASEDVINDEIDIEISALSSSSDTINGTRFYTSSVSNPFSPTPNGGDRYYNTLLNMEMIYDSSRSKWLSTEANKYDFGRYGNTAPGSFYKGSSELTFTTTRGYLMPFSGTIISLTFMRENVLSSIIEILSNGTTIATLSSSAVTGSTEILNADFLKGDIISFRNQLDDGNTTVNVIGSVRTKWRV